MAKVNKLKPKETDEISLDPDLCKDLLIADLELRTFEQGVAEANRKLQEEFAQLRLNHEQALNKLVARVGVEKEQFLREYEINIKAAKARKIKKGNQDAEKNAQS
jgi:hypothetical protein